MTEKKRLQPCQDAMKPEESSATSTSLKQMMGSEPFPKLSDIHLPCTRLIAATSKRLAGPLNAKPVPQFDLDVTVSAVVCNICMHKQERLIELRCVRRNRSQRTSTSNWPREFTGIGEESVRMLFLFSS